MGVSLRKQTTVTDPHAQQKVVNIKLMTFLKGCLFVCRFPEGLFVLFCFIMFSLGMYTGLWFIHYGF